MSRAVSGFNHVSECQTPGKNQSRCTIIFASDCEKKNSKKSHACSWKEYVMGKKLLSPSMSNMVFSMWENTRALSERAQKNIVDAFY